jgi:glucosamine--fructose-6-phosphate aminotransferase (isomerizing)
MCGIVGAVAERTVVPILLEGLRRLEYRGYDSAGVAVLRADGSLGRIRIAGKVAGLEEALRISPQPGTTGIAHTRWATHGRPSEHNAHPFVCRKNQVALVHNGIIENYQTLKTRLEGQGYEFASETDTESIVHTIDSHLDRGLDLLAAVQVTVRELEGAYALGIISAQDPGRLIGVRRGAPLVVGIGIGEHYIASDVAALLPVTQRFIFLEDGDLVDLTRASLTIYDHTGQRVERPVRISELSAESTHKGGYRHYMLKEIMTQPTAIADTLAGRVDDGQLWEEAFGQAAPAIFQRIQAVQICACGTSYHAGLIAGYWMEELTGLPCRVEIASEFRYRRTVAAPDTLFVTISQSGETADTLAALKEAKARGYAHSLALCNVPESSLTRGSELVFLTRAGPEIGVASTKAFTTQLVALLLLVVALGRHHGMARAEERRLLDALISLPGRLHAVLESSAEIESLAERFAHKEHAIYLGRGTMYPVAMEGALKLKEISYIHAEAYPAGELKHGPLALVDEGMPVVAVAPSNDLFAKLKSNLEEVRARGGELFVFADPRVPMVASERIHVLPVASVDDIIAPIVYTVPLQLLAYHVAILKGADVDQPRNLAKSVTVE